MWSDSLSKPEVESTKKAISILKEVEWAKPLLKRFKDGGNRNSGKKRKIIKNENYFGIAFLYGFK